jgi:hypothetical protein
MPVFGNIFFSRSGEKVTMRAEIAIEGPSADAGERIFTLFIWHGLETLKNGFWQVRKI